MSTIDPALMREAVMQALTAMQPVIVEHGAARALPAIASALALNVVACHRIGALQEPVAEATQMLARVFGDSVGGALAGAMDMDGTKGGRA